MDLKTHNDCRAVIAAPAGNLEKLRIAAAYGADEIYFGGADFNLRSQAGNFSEDDILKGLSFCGERGIATTFLLNSFLHENDIDAARRYINEIRRFPFDALMISDPGMLELIRESGIETPIHLSTQMSTLNHLAVKFWQRLGIKRIVLGREISLGEIQGIRDHTDAEIEVFAHGSLCISYSGRCLLSRYLTGRDANLGSCTHPCRWRYALVEEKRPGSHFEVIEHARGTEILSSKDLRLIEKVPAYIEAGVNAFKIEGRMKSLYYTANTTRIYKHAVRTRGDAYARFLPFWEKELDLVSHRPYTDNLFNEFNGSEFSGIPYIKKALFIGYSVSQGRDATGAYIRVFNPLRENDVIDAIYPIDGETVRDSTLTVKSISDDGTGVQMAQPGKIYHVEFDKAIDTNAILRRQIPYTTGERQC